MIRSTTFGPEDIGRSLSNEAARRTGFQLHDGYALVVEWTVIDGIVKALTLHLCDTTEEGSDLARSLEQKQPVIGAIDHA